MGCSACGTTNEAGRKFCKECGSPLALACPECSFANAPDSKFCGDCGASLGATTTAAAASSPTTPERSRSAPSTSAPSTEMRLVSVLFVDLVGFTSLSERRDAEDMRELLGRYFERARETIERHGGLVEKFIGDAVMAVWGTPVAHEDDAERAVRAALDLVDGVAALGDEVGAELRARAGVLTGEAAATVGAVSQGIVAGDMVNTASRLQSAAEPGTVLVGDATHRAAARTIAFEDAGELRLKGKEDAVRAWRALRVVSDLGGGVEPPFVGRSEELRMLKDTLHGVGRERRARLVSVIGTGGIGKSRLAEELGKYVDGITETVEWHRGRCPAHGDGVSFWALGEMVRMRAGLAETDGPAESRRKLSTAVDTYVADPEERRWIEPRLAHLLGIEERPPGEREELFSAWRTFFERVSEKGTTVMVFEDIQWADPGLLDWIESVLEWSRSQPILVITLSRPELQERRPNWGAGQRNFMSVHLEPLPDETMQELIRGLIAGAPDEAVAKIAARSEGVPLYAIETVRMLADRGVLTHTGTAYSLTGDLGDLDTPETLHALIAARLDALDPDDRTLLQDAAVLGKTFTLGGLTSVSDVPVEELEPRLHLLVQKEVLAHDVDPRSPERGQYTFIQGLIREVAYGMLSKPERRRRHLACAHHVESLTDDELAGVVAAHYVAAYRATPEGPDADALAARARDWLMTASERAMSLGSPEQALAFTRRALDITATGAERVALLTKAGRAATADVQLQAAVAFLEEAVSIADAAGDVKGLAQATVVLSRALRQLDRVPEAVERIESARVKGGDGLEPSVRAELDFQLATCLTSGGQLLAEALALAEDVLATIEREDLVDRLHEAIGLKAQILFDLGRHREAAVLSRGALSFAEEFGSWEAKGEALMGLGASLNEDSPREAYDCSRKAAEASLRAGRRDRELDALGNAAEAAVDIGEWAAADAILADLAGRSAADQDPSALDLNLALLSALRGDPASARNHLEVAEERLVRTGWVTLRTWALRIRCVVELMEGELEKAFSSAMEALEIQPTGINAPTAARGASLAGVWLHDPARVRIALDAMRPLRGRWIANVRLATGAALAALEGRTDEAAEAYERAIETWIAMELPLDRAMTTVDAATVLPADLVPKDAVSWAKGFLAELGALPLLERLAATDVVVADVADAEVADLTV